MSELFFRIGCFCTLSVGLLIGVYWGRWGGVKGDVHADGLLTLDAFGSGATESAEAALTLQMGGWMGGTPVTSAK